MDTTPITGRVTFSMCRIHTRIEDTCLCEIPFAGDLEQFLADLPTHFIAESALSPEYIALENATRKLFIANRFKLEKKRATIQALRSEVTLVSITSKHAIDELALEKLKRERVISEQIALLTEESQMREHTITELHEELARVTEQSKMRHQELADLKTAITHTYQVNALKPIKTITKSV